MSSNRDTVLVVEDEVELADLYSQWLEMAFDVRTAYAGEDALNLLDSDVDCVLLDRRMPGLSGDEVLAEVRQRGIDCRVAMVTAIEPDFDIVEMGFDDYIQKPIERGDLISQVDDLLALDTYDEVLQKYFRLASKKASLETSKSPAELEQSAEYSRLVSELESVQAEANAQIDEAENGRVFSDLL